MRLDSEGAFVVNRHRFNGIFLGLWMLRLNGFRLAEAFPGSSWNSAPPIIIVTSDSDRQRITLYVADELQRQVPA